MKKVIVSLLVLAFVALAATGTVSAQCAAKATTTSVATTCAQCTSCQKTSACPDDNVCELSDDGEVHELSDDGEVHELSDDHLEVLRLRDSQTCCGVSYVSACVTPCALKAITYRSSDRV